MDSIDFPAPAIRDGEEAAPPFPADLDLHVPHPPPKFSAPEHPSVRLLETLERGRKQEKDEAPKPPPYQHRDPHEQPRFTNESLKNPVHPVLYLPPLISALPSTQDSDSDGTITKEEQAHPTVLTTSTRLPSIDPVSLSLHRALHYFRPLSDKYASQPYGETFNWDELILPTEEEREWYCVAFRSRRKEGSNGDALYEADRKAHEEAVSNGGVSSPYSTYQGS